MTCLPLLPLLRPILRCCLARLSAATKEVVVSRKAAESVLRGAHVFVPGVLACSAGLAAGDAVVVTVARDVPGR